MNIYNIEMEVDTYDGRRPTVALIRLYRAFHACSLMEAKEFVDGEYDRNRHYGPSMFVPLLGDDTALGRVAYLQSVASKTIRIIGIEKLTYDSAMIR